MSRAFVIPSVLGVLLLTIMVSGCATGSGGGAVETRAYVAQRDRIDQNMEDGNYGYIVGTPIKPDTSKMSQTRQIYVLEFTKNPDVTPEELRKPVPPAQPVTIDVPERRSSAVQEPVSIYEEPVYLPPPVRQEPPSRAVVDAPSSTPSEYVIQSGDTLQKISKKMYGTYKNWYRIYEANKDIISDPNRIKPGLTIRIP